MKSDAAKNMTERLSLDAHLHHVTKVPDDLRHLIGHIARAVKDIQFSLRITEAGLSGTRNQFGEEQLKLDVLSDATIAKHLSESKLVASYASEEHESVIELDAAAPFSVVYDPLDGSSLVDADFAIGSIFGIYAGSGVIGRKPGEQVAALYALYGPRTLIVCATGGSVHEFILNEVGEFVVLREYLGIADDTKHFSPGNIAAVADNDGYRTLLDEWMNSARTLRYSGCMVADVHHVLSKGHGIFLNVGGKKYPEGKLRLAFECGPFAYIVSCAGGVASDGAMSLLEKPIESLDQRTPIICGSKNDVQHAEEVLR